MLDEYRPKKLTVFSRDELKQYEMRAGGLDHASLRYFLGDACDAQSLERALSEVTLVVHAALSSKFLHANITHLRRFRSTSLEVKT